MSKKIVCSSYVIDNSRLRAESFGAKEEINEIMEIPVFSANPSMDIHNLSNAQVAQIEDNLQRRVTAQAIKIKNARAKGIERN